MKLGKIIGAVRDSLLYEARADRACKRKENL